MTRGRLLATFAAGEDAVYCTPSPRGTAVLCVLLPDAEPDPDPTVAFADLLIGKADGASEPLLSVADTVVVWSAADVGFRPTFGFGFPSGPGDHVAWTTRDGATGPETLKLQRAGDAASKVTIASDVHHWDVSPDAARWFWLSGTQGTGVGTLQTAPFPSGANPTDVRADVSDYDIVPSDGKTVVALAKDGTLVAIADPIAAAGELVLDTAVKVLLSLSDAGHVAYVKTRFGANAGDLYVKRADGSVTCVVEPTRQVPFRTVSFVPNAGAILWARSDHRRLRGPLHPPARLQHDARRHRHHADRIGRPRARPVRGPVRRRDRQRHVAHPPVGNGNTLSAEAPIPIADHADSYAITGPNPDTLLYTVNAGGEKDGVYVRWFAD